MEIYGIFDKAEGRIVYVGATEQNARLRFKKHIKDSGSVKPHTKISRLIRTKGYKNFEVQVLKVVDNFEDLMLMEIAFIAKHDTYQNGCNETIGGKGREGSGQTPESIAQMLENRKWYRHSDEVKQKISEAGKGRIFTEETRKKISEANLGREKPKGAESPLFGKRHTDETKLKISEAAKGRIPTDEARANMSAAGKGKPKSDAHRKALSEAKKGKAFSEEHRQKLSEAQQRRFAKKE